MHALEKRFLPLEKSILPLGKSIFQLKIDLPLEKNNLPLEKRILPLGKNIIPNLQAEKVNFLKQSGSSKLISSQILSHQKISNRKSNGWQFLEEFTFVSLITEIKIRIVKF